MLNQKIAKIFEEIADLLEMQDIQFKPRAYRKAAISIRSLSEDIKDIYKKGGVDALEKIPGVGKSMALKIDEMIKTGKIKYYEELKKKMPAAVSELVAIEGVGPKIVKKLYQKLKIRTINDLEKAAQAGKIRKIRGLGPKVEQNILEGIAIVRKRTKRFLLGFTLLDAQEIKKELEKFPGVEKVDLAGSIRRGKETIGDIDILAIAKKPKAVVNCFIHLPQVERILAAGPTKGAVILKNGADCDLRVLKKESYGAALMYFTGSKAHNIKIRKIAQSHHWKLSEYGLFSKKKKIAGRTEEEVFKKLGLSYIEPELREDRGEVEAAQQHKLPKLVVRKDIKGVFHVHSKWSRGDATGEIIDIARKCKQMGWQYVSMADHVGTLRIAGGMTEKELLSQKKEIEQVNKQIKNFKILTGCEANILKDGRIDISDKVLAQLDVVIAAVHSHFKMGKQEMTKRIIRAMKNKNVDIIAHPTGRIIQEREPYQVDLEKIMTAAVEYNVVLEINAFPDRLDLKDTDIKLAIEHGCKLSIGLDAHNLDQLHHIDLGLITARRGWAERKDIINTFSWQKVLKLFSG